MTEIQFLVAELSCWTYTGFSRDNRYNFYVLIDFGFSDEINNLKVMYGVYVVEQDGKTPFNRAMLMNVGAAEAVKQQVFIFLALWFLFTFKCPGLPVLHFPWCWLATGGRQKPVHLPNPTEAHVSVHW